MKLLVLANEQRTGPSLSRDLGGSTFDLDLVADGAEALRFAQSRSYEAIVLDLAGSREVGLELCRRLRETGDWTPILAITASESDVERALLLDSGVDTCLARPFSDVVLAAHLRALARRNGHRR
jgi:DNA-binding response OmpR family regulator